jgi:hypothetical protein
MKVLYEITVKLTVYADNEQSAYDIIENDIDSLVSESEQLQNYAIGNILTVETE